MENSNPSDIDEIGKIDKFDKRAGIKGSEGSLNHPLSLPVPAPRDAGLWVMFVLLILGTLLMAWVADQPAPREILPAVATGG